MSRILIVDDEPPLRRILRSNLTRDGHRVFEAAGVQEARRLINENHFDTVITDQKMQDGEGLEVLAASLESDPTTSVMFLTAFATVELAVQSMRHGAFDFITKPFTPDVVRAAVRRACERTSLLRENDLLRNAFIRMTGSTEILGESMAMNEVRGRIARVAPTNATVLIVGETGTGKELVAQAIHHSGTRSNKAFLAVNCAAFTESLLESELFGHERGAFTGAEQHKEGLFEAAHEGTLFLDEVGDMSLSAQSKLLRVLTDGQVVRVGATRPRTVDVRVLAATHQDLLQRVSEKLFREDLYYRLAVVPIPIPPLRDRREDIPILSKHFLEQATKELKIQPRTIASAALERLMCYHFPGNVRELRNLVERAVILSRDANIGPEDFPVPGFCEKTPCAEAPWLRSLPRSFDLRECLYNLEKELILRALKDAGGSQAAAGRLLGISRSEIGYKLSKFGLKGNSE